MLTLKHISAAVLAAGLASAIVVDTADARPGGGGWGGRWAGGRWGGGWGGDNWGWGWGAAALGTGLAYASSSYCDPYYNYYGNCGYGYGSYAPAYGTVYAAPYYGTRWRGGRP